MAIQTVQLLETQFDQLTLHNEPEDFFLPDMVNIYVLMRARLIPILNTLEQAPDLLAKKAVRCLSPFVKIDPAQLGDDPENFTNYKRCLVDRLEELHYDILLNPLTWQPLCKPMLDRKWVWEKSVLEDYLTFNKPSPFDNEPIQAVVYSSLEELIEWKNFWVIERDVSLGSALMVRSENLNSAERFSRFYTYVSNARKAVQIEGMFLRNQALEKRIVEQQAINEARELESKRKLGELLALVQEIGTEAKRELTNLRDTLQTNNTLLTRRVADVEERNQNLQQTVHAQATSIANLASQVQSLSASMQGQQSTIDALNAQIHGLSKKKHGIRIKW